MTDPAVPRRYALLSQRGSVWSLARAIGASDRRELIDWRPAGADVPPEEAWKFIRDVPGIEAVLVDADDAPTLDSARQLAMRGMPLVVHALASLPPEFITEMSLYDAEGSTRIVPWFDHRQGLEGRQDWAHLKQWLKEMPADQITSIHLERSLEDQSRTNDVRREAFLTETLLADLDLLRMIGGDYSQVTLIRTGGDERSYDSQTLQLAGPGLPDATCTYRRSNVPSGLNLRIDGTTSHAQVVAEDDNLVWRVDGREVDRYQPPEDWGDDARIAQRDSTLSMLDDLLTHSRGAARWSDLVRIFDIAEAMERSLRRRRTIDLHFETTSERSQFKTHMAAIGCGVILWTMFGIIGLLFAGAVLDPRDNMQRTAEAADFVLRNDEFTRGSPTPTDEGGAHVRQIAEQMNLNESVVFIEATDAPDIDAARLASVRNTLAEKGADEEGRVVVRPLRGQWFTLLMQLARVLVFAPVGVFLLFQVLLLIAKPAAASKQRNDKHV